MSLLADIANMRRRSEALSGIAVTAVYLPQSLFDAAAIAMRAPTELAARKEFMEHAGYRAVAPIPL